MDVYNTSMRKVLDSYAPLKTRCVSVRPSAPWTGEEIREVKRAVRRAEKLANRSKLTVHTEIFVSNVTCQRVSTTRQIKNATVTN